ncbi:MAG: helix-hairpin-helix domain-containing protein [Clostridiales Family XIII bacterium]|jgi:competence protein ComEA|nr:helix-hairpin-helix domain-containing protein [Clostridiales Family XIII bacterium]
MQNKYTGVVDFRNPRHIKRAIILIGVAGIIILAAIRYGGDAAPGLAGTDDVGDVISRTESAEEVAALSEPGPEAGASTEPPAATMSGVSIAEPGTVFIDVAGAVNSPDVYELDAGSRVNEAIVAAGGLSKDADTRYINKAVVLNDGDRIYIPTEKEVASGQPIPASAGLASGAPGAATALAGAGASDAGASPDAGGGGNTDAGAMININSADVAALQVLNGVGPVTAQKIVDYRTSNGAFAKIEDLKNVSGIGEKTFEKLKEHITV